MRKLMATALCFTLAMVLARAAFSEELLAQSDLRLGDVTVAPSAVSSAASCQKAIFIFDNSQGQIERLEKKREKRIEKRLALLKKQKVITNKINKLLQKKGSIVDSFIDLVKFLFSETDHERYVRLAAERESIAKERAALRGDLIDLGNLIFALQNKLSKDQPRSEKCQKETGITNEARQNRVKSAVAEQDKKNEIEACIRTSTFQALPDPSKLKISGTRFRAVFLVNGFKNAQLKCDLSALQRIMKAIAKLNRAQLKKLQQFEKIKRGLSRAERLKLFGGQLGKKQAANLRSDFRLLLSIEFVMLQNIRACEKRKKLNIPANATAEQIKKQVEESVEQKAKLKTPGAGGAKPSGDKSASTSGSKKSRVSDDGLVTRRVDIPADDAFGTYMNLDIGGLLRSGTNNNAGSVVAPGQGFKAVARGNNLAGVQARVGLNINLGKIFAKGANSYLNVGFGLSHATGSSTGSSAPSDVAYIPYVNNKPPVGLGAVGETARLKTILTKSALNCSFTLHSRGIRAPSRD